MLAHVQVGRQNSLVAFIISGCFAGNDIITSYLTILSLWTLQTAPREWCSRRQQDSRLNQARKEQIVAAGALAALVGALLHSSADAAKMAAGTLFNLTVGVHVDGTLRWIGG